MSATSSADGPGVPKATPPGRKLSGKYSTCGDGGERTRFQAKGRMDVPRIKKIATLARDEEAD